MTLGDIRGSHSKKEYQHRLNRYSDDKDIISSPVLQISRWMVKIEWEREESLFISV